MPFSYNSKTATAVRECKRLEDERWKALLERPTPSNKSNREKDEDSDYFDILDDGDIFE